MTWPHGGSDRLPEPQETAASDPAVRSLIGWNRFWLAVLILAGLALWAASQLNEALEWRRQHLEARLWEAKLSLAPLSDGPFVITHLVSRSESPPYVRYALLPQPVVIVDSEGTSVDSAVLGKLVWRDKMHRRVPAPPSDAVIRALYQRPLETESPLPR